MPWGNGIMSENKENENKSSSNKGTIVSGIGGLALIVGALAQITGNLKPVWELLGISKKESPTESIGPTMAAEPEVDMSEQMAKAEKVLADLEPDYEPADADERKISAMNGCNRTMQVKLIYEMPDGKIDIAMAPTDYPAGDYLIYPAPGDLDAKTKRKFVLVRTTTMDGTAQMAGDYSFSVGGKDESYQSVELEIDEEDGGYWFELTCPA